MLSGSSLFKRQSHTAVTYVRMHCACLPMNMPPALTSFLNAVKSNRQKQEKDTLDAAKADKTLADATATKTADPTGDLLDMIDGANAAQGTKARDAANAAITRAMDAADATKAASAGAKDAADAAAGSNDANAASAGANDVNAEDQKPKTLPGGDDPNKGDDGDEWSWRCADCNEASNNLRQCFECYRWDCKKCAYWCTRCPRAYTVCGECYKQDVFLTETKRGTVWKCGKCESEWTERESAKRARNSDGKDGSWGEHTV